VAGGRPPGALMGVVWNYAMSGLFVWRKSDDRNHERQRGRGFVRNNGSHHSGIDRGLRAGLGRLHAADPSTKPITGPGQSISPAAITIIRRWVAFPDPARHADRRAIPNPRRAAGLDPAGAADEFCGCIARPKCCSGGPTRSL